MIIVMSWQRRTMAMMYRRVGNALRQARSSAHPQDYLLFLTPLAREDEDDVPDCLEDDLEPGSNAERLRSSRRLMIYVHSKLMVVDDSAAIIGIDLGFGLSKMQVPDLFSYFWRQFSTSFNSE